MTPRIKRLVHAYEHQQRMKLIRYHSRFDSLDNEVEQS